MQKNSTCYSSASAMSFREVGTLKKVFFTAPQRVDPILNLRHQNKYRDATVCRNLNWCLKSNWKLSPNNNWKYTHYDRPENKTFPEQLLKIQMLRRGSIPKNLIPWKSKINKEVVQKEILENEVDLIDHIMYRIILLLEWTPERHEK